MFPKKLKHETLDYSSITVKAVSVQYLLFMVLAGQVGALWFSAKENLFPGAEAFQQIVGTCAEIIAGLYGSHIGLCGGQYQESV